MAAENLSTNHRKDNNDDIHIKGNDEFSDPDDEAEIEIVADVLEGMLYFTQKALAEKRARRDNTLRRKDDHANKR